MASYLLGIDAGSTTIKAVLYDLQGNQVYMHAEDSNPLFPEKDWVEYDLAVFKEKMFDACARVVENSGVDPADILALSFSTTSYTVHLLDENCKPVYNSLSWNDLRGTPYHTEFVKTLDLDARYQKTGTEFSYVNGLLKLVWLRDHRPDLMEKTRWISDSMGYILSIFGAQEPVVDLASYGRLTVIDIRTREVDKSLVAEFNIDTDKFPRLGESGKPVGKISKEVAQRTGLSEGTLLVVGLQDTIACQYGAGVVRGGQANLNTGTFGNCAVVTDTLTQDHKLYIKCNPGLKNWTIDGMSYANAANFNWFREVFGHGEKLAAQLTGGNAYEILANEAAMSAPGANGITYLPYLSGNKYLPGGSGVRGAYHGLSMTTKRPDVIRALMEGVCYEMYVLIERARNGGSPVEMVRMSGGVAHSPFWSQMHADVLGVPVEKTVAAEAGTLGAAMAAGVGAGVYRDFVDAVDKCVSVGATYQPDSKLHAQYQDAFQRFKEFTAKLV